MEPSVARPKAVYIKRRGGGHTTYEVSHCLLDSFCVLNTHERKLSVEWHVVNRVHVHVHERSYACSAWRKALGNERGIQRGVKVIIQRVVYLASYPGLPSQLFLQPWKKAYPRFFPRLQKKL